MWRIRGADLRARRNVLWLAMAIGAPFLITIEVAPLLHAIHPAAAGDPWLIWALTPGISLGLILAAGVYVAGQRVPYDSRTILRHICFFGGLAALFLALQSPIEWIADHVFAVHQVEHMLLRTVAPCLLVLAAPQAALVRGLPNWLRRRLLAPVVASAATRRLAIVGHPTVATALFIAVGYFWMIPHFHDSAILDGPVHNLWHVSLLLAGFIFFRRLLDPRPRPLGLSLPARLQMFWFAASANILLGSYLSLKSGVLYHAYDEMGRLWVLHPAEDENFGGLIMWVPGTMMLAAAALLAIYGCSRREEQRLIRAVMAPTSGATVTDWIAQRRPANRRLALGLLAFTASILALTFATVLIYHSSQTIYHSSRISVRFITGGVVASGNQEYPAAGARLVVIHERDCRKWISRGSPGTASRCPCDYA